MTDQVVIFVTASNQEECRRIAHFLVENRLAACVNITQPIESVYRWQGKVEQEQEFQLFIKSTRALFPDVRTAITRLHSYQTPEIVCLPIIDGSEAYLQWIADSVKPTGSD